MKTSDVSNSSGALRGKKLRSEVLSPLARNRVGLSAAAGPVTTRDKHTWLALFPSMQEVPKYVNLSVYKFGLSNIMVSL